MLMLGFDSKQNESLGLVCYDYFFDTIIWAADINLKDRAR